MKKYNKFRKKYFNLGIFFVLISSFGFYILPNVNFNWFIMFIIGIIGILSIIIGYKYGKTVD